MRAFAILVGLMTILVGSVRVSADSAPAANAISVEVRGLHSARGQVLCFLYASAAGYPQDASRAARRTTAAIVGGGATCQFVAVAAGQYAVAVVHDENDNGRLDRNLMGMPAEGVGASNDPVSHFGPPKFQDARFAYAGGHTTLVVHVHYLL
jgi:uncharacterized protein (DUF2141 family)